MLRVLVKTILTPPEFADEEKTRIMRLLNIVQWVGLAFLLAAMLLAWSNQTLPSFWLLLAEAVVLSATIWLARAGRPHLASLIFLVVMVFVMLGLLAAGNGVHDISIMVFPLLIILASLLLQRRMYILFCIFLALSVNAFVAAEILGWVVNPYGHFVDLSDAIYFNLILGMASIGMGLMANSLLLNLYRARMSEQKLLAAHIQRDELYRRAIAAADAVPYYLDYSLGRYTFIGSGITNLLGYPPEEVTPELVNQLSLAAEMQGEHAGRSREEAENLVRSGKSLEWRCDHLTRTRTGEQRWYTDSAVQVRSDDGRLIGSIGILMDITNRKQAEAAIRALNVELEQRVRDRTAELELAVGELEAFTYSVSHDLRAPLRAVNGYSHLLQEDYLAALDDDGRIYLENLTRAAGRMGQLIDDLMNLSRISRWQMRSLPVDLSQVAGEVLAALRQANPERQVTASIQPGIMAQGDPNLLRILMENLLGNAWKFTGKTPLAQIEFSTRQEADGVIYVVSDNGAGFDMTFADRLFNPFERLHHEDDFEGTGIGLATVKRIVRRHGGKIWADAVAGRGASFFFTLGDK